MTQVQHNMNAINAYNRLNGNVAGLRKASEKLASGYRINRAGDDAAGLAISEKMRSQIRGLNQAVRNSQDGINMIQTFEGAAQETHSILQRMKELAMESANGTYDNSTDRAAIQLEFEQLNDELNQIADTDFNGTIVLNGGEMADGLKQVDGNFDYRMKAGQVADAHAKALADAQAKAQASIDAAQKTFDSALAAYKNVTERDLCLNGDAVQWNTVDDNAYSQEVADGLFAAAKNGTDTLADLNVEEFNVTFTFTEGAAGAAGTWTIDEAYYIDENGDKQTVDLSGTGLVDANITATKNGGFTIKNAYTDGDGNAVADATGHALGNAIFAMSNAKTGDVVTLKYTNTAKASFAPTNIGIDEETLDVKADGVKNVPKLTLDAGITDDAIANNGEIMDALVKLDQASVEFLYSGSGITGSISDSSLILTPETEDGSTGNFTISFEDSAGRTIKLATIAMDPSSGKTKDTTATTAATATTDFAAQPATVTPLTLTYKEDKADATKTGWYNGATKVDLTTGVKVPGALGNGTAIDEDSGAITITGQVKDGDTIVLSGNTTDTKISVTYNGQPATDGTVGTVKFDIALDEGKYDPSTVGPTIDPSSNPDKGTDSRAVDEAYEKALDKLNAAKAAYPKTYDDLGLSGGVTKADAFDNSTARLTYTDNLTLQTGARTKDAVNFTFAYNTDDSADMGNLKANLNLSAREDGLNTASLSLANQKDANYAIDQIDKAINKTSMVRATFGAIQNRLEHKITNLTTTSENLTEAESSIRDTDMASEMMNYTKFNILQQAAQSMLAQANQQPQSILQLLG